jgi:hypothetical protein
VQPWQDPRFTRFYQNIHSKYTHTRNYALFHRPNSTTSLVRNGEVLSSRSLVLLADHIADLLVLGLLDRRLVGLITYWLNVSVDRKCRSRVEHTSAHVVFLDPVNGYTNDPSQPRTIDPTTRIPLSRPSKPNHNQLKPNESNVFATYPLSPRPAPHLRPSCSACP